jgi:ankyrin repeat protein
MLHLGREPQEDNLEEYLINVSTYVESLNGSTLLHRLASFPGPIRSFTAFLRKHVSLQTIDQRNKDGDTALMLAVRAGLVEKVDALVTAGANVSMTNSSQETPLSYACNNFPARDAVLEALLRSPTAAAALSVLRSDGETALGYATHKNNQDLMKRLLDAKAYPNQANSHGETPLGLLIDSLPEADFRMFKPMLLQKLLNAGATVGGYNSDGESYLRRAVSADDTQHISTDFVKRLLQAGANPWIPDGDGETPFAVATEVANDDVIVAMLEVPALGAVEIVNKHIPLLMTALREGRERLAAAMIKAGADVTEAAGGPWTPLAFICVRAEQSMAVRLIRSLKCHRSAFGGLVLDIIAADRVEVLKAFKEAGGELGRFYNNTGTDSLMLACKQPSALELATVLLRPEPAVKLDARDHDRRTALTYAADAGKSAVVQLLLELGADAKARTNDGRTVLMFGATAEVMEMLIQHLEELYFEYLKEEAAMPRLEDLMK